MRSVLQRYPFRSLSAFAVVLAAAMLSPVRFEVNIAFWDATMDLCHVPIFAGLCVLLAVTNPCRIRSRSGNALTAAGVSLLAAVLVEFAQGYTGRTPSAHDALLGALGILPALLYLVGRRWFATGAATVALGMGLAPVIQEARAIVWRATHFPLLGDFEDSAEFPLWRTPSNASAAHPASGQINDRHATHGQRSLKVRFRKIAFSGVRLLCADQDWSRQTTLAFDLFNPGPAFPLVIRIDDAKSTSDANRFKRTITITTGANAVRIPLLEILRSPSERPLDLTRIRRVLFFERSPAVEHEVYLDFVRLE